MANRRIFDIIFRTKGADKSKQESDQLGGSLEKLAKVAKTAAAGFISFQTALKSVELAKLAAQTETVRKSFINLAKEPDKMLQSMKKATAGTISEMELMQKFNEAALLGLPLDRFDEMLEVARGAAQSTGQSMDFMLNSIVVALGRQSKLMLDNLGILIDAETANKNFASANNIVGRSLTDLEKKQAFVNEALTIGQLNLTKMGGVTEASVDQFDALNASFSDLQNRIGQKLLPSILPFIGFLQNIITIGTKSSDNIRSQSSEFNALLDILKDVNTEESVRDEAIKRINNKYPTLVSNIDLQTSSTEDLVSLQKQSNAEFEKQIRLQVANEILADQLKEIAKAEKELIELRLQQSKGIDLVRMGSGKNVQENDRLNQKIDAQRDKLQGLRNVYKETNGQLLQQGILISQTTKSQVEVADANDIATSSYKNLQIRTSDYNLTMSEVNQNAIDNLEPMQQSINLSGALASSLQTAFDPNLGAGEAFKGFILQVIQSIQGVIVASGQMSKALTLAFTPLGVGASIAALIALEAAKASVRSIKFAQFGMDEMVSQPTLIMAGEAGPERVQVTPATRPGASQSGGGMTINFNGPITSKEFVRDTIIPEIKNVQKLGLA